MIKYLFVPDIFIASVANDFIWTKIGSFSYCDVYNNNDINNNIEFSISGDFWFFDFY
jgi:hypothetical protein